MKLTDSELNVFVDYITQKLLFYQNELFKYEVNSKSILFKGFHKLSPFFLIRCLIECVNV